MNVKLAADKAGRVKADLIVIPVAKGKESEGAVSELHQALRKAVAARVKKTAFKAEPGKLLSVQASSGDLVLVGMGDADTPEAWRRAAAKACAAAKNVRAKAVAICPGAAEDVDALVAPLVEGFLLAAYAFDKYKSKKKDRVPAPRSLLLSSPSLSVDADARAALKRIVSRCQAVCFSRDLVNEMSAVKTPSFLAQTAEEIAEAGGLSCEVWQGERLREERMNGILAVSAGSRESGALIKLVYTPQGKVSKRVAVVGKGITFDSGGLSLKPAGSMMTMKLDMSGAAAVLGLMKALPSAAPSVEVTGYIAAAENMPGGRAQKPGDIITYRNGTTAEVLNTDAEGRLVLADALCLAAEDKPDCIIDLATLTGACMVALGSRVAGVLGNEQDLVDALIEHSRQTGESMWQLPLVEDYVEDIRSGVADIKNIGSNGYGGTITAALFLRSFVGKCNWAHIDIAGPAFAEKDQPYTPKGGSGFGIRTLLSYLAALS